MTVTSVQIIDMFEMAHDVEKKLPAAVQNGMSSMRFDVVNDKTEHAAWKKAKVRLTATAREIAVYEYVLFYLNVFRSNRSVSSLNIPENITFQNK